MGKNQRPNGAGRPGVTDPFRALGVGYDATPREVTAAFRRLAKQTHPDRNPGAGGAAFRAAKAAHAALGTPRALDAARRRWAPSGAAPLYPPGQTAAYPTAAERRLWSDRAQFPVCPVVFVDGRHVPKGRPPAGWTPGPTPPPFSRAVSRCVPSDCGPHYGIWELPFGPMDVGRFRFGPPAPVPT